MEKKSFCGILLVCIFITAAFSDTFKHKETGETFNGFLTQKATANQIRVYNSEEKKFTSINPNDYEITFNHEGRRENVVIIPINKPEILISQTVAQQVAEAITDASNAGPLAILVQIDSSGGRGEYMKIIASAITQTTNCPVVAYISGGPSGGAFNAAAVIAMACDKVFIAPSAAIGAVGPLVGGSRSSNDDYNLFLKTYAPDSLATYNMYVTALAQEQNRPQNLVRGLIDKKLSIVEVTNPNGSRDYILKDERQPNQTIVRTLAEGITNAESQSEENASSAIDVAGTVLNLTASDAVKTGLADEIAASRQDVIAAMKIPNAQIVSAQGIDNVIKKFSAAKRNIATGLAQIDRMEMDAERLNASLQQVEDELRTGSETREVEQVQRRTYTNDDRGTNNNRNNSYDEDADTRFYGYNDSDRSTSRKYNRGSRERVTTVVPATDPEVLRQDLSVVLRQLTGEYRRVINLAERWPGGLPVDVSLNTLQSNLDSATVQLNSLSGTNTNTRNRNMMNQRTRRGY